MDPIIQEKLDNLPDKPGVYLMKNGSKKIIYVGKAKSLRKRVRSYFSSTEKDIKTTILVENIRDIEVIITNTEFEAFLLENNLIKQWNPRFNINLKDGKTYPVIRITNEAFPRIFKTRRIIMDGSVYYGPYPNVNQIDIYLKIIENISPLRKCKTRGALKKRSSPCLYYHIHRCSAPCCGFITQEDYNSKVDKIKKLLSGDIKSLVSDFTAQMKEASASLEFEKAATLRDKINAIKQFTEGQKVVDFKQEDRDYIGFAAEDTLITFIVFQMREGKLIGQERFRSKIYSEPEEGLVQFVIQHYRHVTNIPPNVYVAGEVDVLVLERFVEQKYNKKVKFYSPKRGKHLKTIAMANENARADIKERSIGEQLRESVERLGDLLELPKPPRRIEGFDISHLAGKHTVAAMVSFSNGRPDKNNYRYFKIKSLEAGQIDDFESMREAVARRYTRIINENQKKPDLILIDGGKGQLSAAYNILEALGAGDIPIIGLAKREEEIFKPGETKPLILERREPALRLLQAVRDESHRFGISLIRRLAVKSLSESIYENVKGIGKQKSKELITHYGTPENVLKADPEKVATDIKVSLEVAEELFKYLRENKQPVEDE